jgi:hypothetical protein
MFWMKPSGPITADQVILEFKDTGEVGYQVVIYSGGYVGLRSIPVLY